MTRTLFALLLALMLPVSTASDSSLAVGLIWWPADPADPRYKFGRQTEACLSQAIRSEAPHTRLVPQQSIRDSLFPLLEPATQPADEQAFAALLSRPDVQARLRDLGLSHLVAFTGGTSSPGFRGLILCGAGYGGGGCFGFAWEDKSTQLAAALWDLARHERIAEEKAKVEGRTVVPAFGLPLPLVARTYNAACDELGSRISRAIMGVR